MNSPKDIAQVLSSLRETHSETVIIQLVYNQLQKDFRSAGADPGFGPEIPHHLWAEELARSLAPLPAHVIAALLYSVDIPESAAAAAENYEALAGLILYREFIKIYFRLKYQ